jgi:hypothetical protein
MDIVCDLVDQACWPFEALPVPELQFNQDSVEKGASIAQDCPGDSSTHLGCEGVPDNVDLLLVQSFTDLQ